MLRRIDEILAGGVVEPGPREATWLLEEARRTSPDDVERKALELARRRAGGEPLQYVLGTAAFRYLELEVGPGVLVPRPETEVLTERALARLPRGGVAVDVGTGSGAIALSIKKERPDAEVFATDDSDDALAYARANQARLGLEVTILRGRLLEPLPEALASAVDVVVSNPPYVAFHEKDSLPVDVVDHEPHHALFAGPDGLDVLSGVAEESTSLLRPGGWLVCEIGVGQNEAARALFERHGYRAVELHDDLGGRPRIVEGRWSP